MTKEPTDGWELMKVMFEAIIDRIGKPNAAWEEIFAAYDDPQMVRRAIAVLAVELLTYTDETNWPPGKGASQKEVLDEFVAAVSRNILDDDYEFSSKAA